MLRDILPAIRTLRSWRSGAVAAILTLAVGIGTTTSLYALVRLATGDFTGVPELGRIARIYSSNPTLGIERQPPTFGEFEASLSRATSFQSIGAYAQADATIGSAADAQKVALGFASPGLFNALGVPAAAGRVFTSEDAEAHQPVVVLSDTLWRRQFPDGRLAGASMVVNGVERAVIGVMPRGFSYPLVGVMADLWIPLTHESVESPATVTVFARLGPGVAWPAADAELISLSGNRNRGTWRAIPIQEDKQHRAVGAFLFQFGPALLILLLGCVNVSCMLMARGVERDKELSVRRALGATRARLVRQLLTENLLLAFAGGAFGCGLAVMILRYLSATLAKVQPAMAERIAGGFDLLPLALVATLVSCILFGTLPAWRLAHRDVAASLNGVPAKYRVHVAGYGARDLIVFLETGSAVGLMVFAAMIFNLFGEMARVTPLFPADHVVIVNVPARDADEARERIAAVPGVTRVVVASALPGSAVGWRGAAPVQTDEGRTVRTTRVPADAALFETLGLALVRGRSFDATENRAQASVTVLSEGAARLLSPDADPLGMNVRIAGRPMVVIGICRDAINYGAIGRAGFIPPDIYVPYEPPADADVIVLARVSTDARGLFRAIAAAADSPSRRRPAEPALLAERLRFANGDDGALVSRLFGAFALVALLLAASGVYGVIAQSVAQRTREFGIRMALGAAPRRVLGMVLVRETKLISAALLAGAAVTFGIARATFIELARLSAATPTVWLGAVFLCAVVAIAACFFATRRIVRLNPWVVLSRF